nr:recombinase family protein [Ensifer sesbaniae]
MVATRPVDFRKGAEGLAALVKAEMGADPFSGTIYVFRAKRAQLPPLCIPFSFCDDRISLASAVWDAGCKRIHEERASGGRWDRPELHRLLDELDEGDVVVVWKLDRLTWSLKDMLLILEKVEAAGAGFRSLTEAIDTTTPAGRMMMQMLGSFAEFERAIVRERTMAGLQAARERGRRVDAVRN